MNILITGGRGFIGRHLTEILGKKYTIFSPSHKELELLDAEAVKKFVEDNKIKVVVHSANRGGSRKDVALTETTRDNIRMFLNIAACEQLVSRIIFLGSGAEYGKQRSIENVTEEEFGQVIPKDDYGLAKFAISKIISGLEKAVNLRCFAVYGPYEDYDVRLVSYAICRALLNLPINLKQDTVFDYMYVSDVVKVVEYFIENKPKEKFYNLGSGQGVKLTEMVNLVKKVLNSNVDVSIAQPGLGRKYTCDMQKLNNEIQGFEFVSQEEGVKKTAEYLRTNFVSLNLDNVRLDKF